MVPDKAHVFVYDDISIHVHVVDVIVTMSGGHHTLNRLNRWRLDFRVLCLCHSESPVANMRNSDVFFGLCFILSFLSVISSDNPNAFVTQDTPSVMVALLVRNKAHVLPWSLHYIQHLEYQKDRMSLW